MSQAIIHPSLENSMSFNGKCKRWSYKRYGWKDDDENW